MSSQILKNNRNDKNNSGNVNSNFFMVNPNYSLWKEIFSTYV